MAVWCCVVVLFIIIIINVALAKYYARSLSYYALVKSLRCIKTYISEEQSDCCEKQMLCHKLLQINTRIHMRTCVCRFETCCEGEFLPNPREFITTHQLLWKMWDGECVSVQS